MKIRICKINGVYFLQRRVLFLFWKDIIDNGYTKYIKELDHAKILKRGLEIPPPKFEVIE